MTEKGFLLQLDEGSAVTRVRQELPGGRGRLTSALHTNQVHCTPTKITESERQGNIKRSTTYQQCETVQEHKKRHAKETLK